MGVYVRPLLFLSALLVLLSVCSDSTGPAVGLGSYYLTTLDGLPPPFTLSDDHFSTGERIVVERIVDSISIRSTMDLYRAQEQQTTFYAPDGSSHSANAGWGNSGTFHVTGRRMIIEFVDLIGDATPPETLEVVSDDVLIGRKLVRGWCLAGPPMECPTTPRIREFKYTRN